MLVHWSVLKLGTIFFHFGHIFASFGSCFMTFVHILSGTAFVNTPCMKLDVRGPNDSCMLSKITFLTDDLISC